MCQLFLLSSSGHDNNVFVCPSDTKMDRKDKLFVVNEVSLSFSIWTHLMYSHMHYSIAKDQLCSQVCEIKNCNKCLFFEAKKKQDLYMW